MASPANAAATPAATKTPGVLIKELTELREKIRGLEKDVNSLKAEKKDIEQEILDLLENSGGLQQMATKYGTVTVTEADVASVEDWDQFYTWIRRNNAFYLLQRRANNAPYRELMESRRGRKIPGVSTVKTRSLSLRKK